MTAGYSGAPLARKLGIKPGWTVAALNAPDDYLDLLAPLPEGASVVVGPVPGATSGEARVPMVHLFTKSRAELESCFTGLMDAIPRDGMIWVSWPKKASRVQTDMTEDVVREVALPRGLVDTKVCAIDATWSGLRLVYRKENR